jgi:hypothetical protein
MMNRFRPIILAFAVVAAGLLAYGLFTQPTPKSSDAEGFSAARVVEDIAVISKDHHSVAHPQERAQVREYLIDRLEGLGADTVMTFRYDSLVGPENRHVEYTFDAHDILAEFAPLEGTGNSPYLMMVAHYDSRYSQPMPKDTVWSYGAADDGYGLGVTLEVVSQLLKDRKEWKQGVKVLFTDAEEVGMMGMKAILQNDKHVFDNVGLMINLEARGTYGPVLLFETCPGNEKVMDLYAGAAKYPYTYSLTTTVYKFMPMYTDFTAVKDEIPGLNFSNIADVNHYHTDLDNFSNISEKTIQHYGAQVLPVAKAYVTGDFQDKDAFKAEKDTVNFTVPGLGLFNFSKISYLIINIVLALVFFLLCGFEVMRGRLSVAKALKTSGIVLVLAIAVLALGELVAYLCSIAAGAKFKPFGTVAGVSFDNIAMIVSTVVLALCSVMIYMNIRRKAVRKTAASMRHSAGVAAASKNAFVFLYGTLFLMTVLALVLVFALGENLMFFIPLFCATLAVILWHVTSLKVWLLAAIVFILLHAFSFFFALAMALTIGAYGAVAMLAFFDLMVLIPLADLYLTERRK